MLQRRTVGCGDAAAPFDRSNSPDRLRCASGYNGEIDRTDYALQIVAVTSVKPPTLHADGPCDGGLTKGMAARFNSCRSVWETFE